ncbi:corA, partial [Symbiodinium necroappetens]
VELDWVQRKVRPILKVLKHLIKDKAIDPDVTRYLEDVEDHLNLFLEEVSRIIGVCNSLRDEVNSYRDRQQQKVLYVLTLVTTLVMPTHLLTGIFGMNWIDEEGQPVVPGFGVMAENRGYYLFWGPAGLCVIWKLKVSIVR